jgi:hypothetical protein
MVGFSKVEDLSIGSIKSPGLCGSKVIGMDIKS